MNIVARNRKIVWKHGPNWPATHYARSVSVLKLPEKMCYPSSRNIYVTKYQVNQVPAENIGIKVSALITPS